MEWNWCSFEYRVKPQPREWNVWVLIERLAHDRERLAEMCRTYLAADEKSFKPFVDRWPAMVESYVRAT